MKKLQYPTIKGAEDILGWTNQDHVSYDIHVGEIIEVDEITANELKMIYPFLVFVEATLAGKAKAGPVEGSVVKTPVNLPTAYKELQKLAIAKGLYKVGMKTQDLINILKESK